MILRSMHGLGDNLHIRSVVRELMRDNELWLRTPWPQIFHDFEGLHLLRLEPTLRVMADNQNRCARLYPSVVDSVQRIPGFGAPPPYAKEIGIAYPPADVKKYGSVLGAMSAFCNVPLGDFRMPVPEEWINQARALPIDWTRPLAIYRPLVERIESRGYAVRNPDHAAYHELISAIRDRYFVVSIASLSPRNEWTVGPQITADLEFHEGELWLETIIGLTRLAHLVFSAPGFMAILAQAVGTPAVTVFGGFEDHRSFSAGARYSSWLPIEPIHPCACWSHDCKHSKEIDLPLAHERISEFLNQRVSRPPVQGAALYWR